MARKDRTFTMVEAWHFPLPSVSKDDRLPALLRVLKRYGVKNATQPSTLLPNHLGILVPESAFWFAAATISKNFSRR